jgi:hypothetical protein
MLVDLTIKGFLAETAGSGGRKYLGSERGYCDGTYRDGGKPDDR